MKEQDFIKTKGIFEKRIDKLEKNQQYLEIVLLLSAILERELQEILFQYEDLIRVSLAMYNDKRVGFTVNRFARKNIEKMTIGEMINYASLCSKNKTLFKELREFNDLRIKVIHKLYDIESIPLLERQIKKYLPKFWKLMAGLSELEVSLLKLITKYKEDQFRILKKNTALKTRKK